MSSGLLGREAELALLQTALRRVLDSGQAGMVLLRGESGIGKSTLLREFIDSVPAVAGERPVLVGYGQSMTNSLGSDAFQAVRECLRGLVSSADRSRSRDTLGRVAHAFRVHAPDWLESVPMVGPVLAAGAKTGLTAMEAAGPPEHLHSRLDQLTALVADLFRTGPVVLVLDDLHWADGATIDVLMALALKVNGPLLLVMAYRPDDLRPAPGGEPHPLTRAVFRLRRYRPECKEVELKRLSRADTRSLILASARGEGMPEAQVEQMVEQSGGVPLYAESLALVRNLGDEADRAGGPPREIAAVMEERLSFTSQEEQRVLEVAVGVGFTLEVQLVAELARPNGDDVYDRLDTVMRDHHLIVEAEPLGSHDRYALYHPMLGEVLRRRGSANAPRWRRYHQRLVDILLTQPASDEISARAAAAAVVARDPRTAALTLDAARRQYAAGAVAKARELAETAVSLAHDSALFFDAAELLARALAAQASHREAAELCAQALARVDNDQVTERRVHELRLLQARSLRMTNQWEAASTLLATLEASLPADAADVRPQVLMLRAEAALCGPRQDTDECIKLCDRVVEGTVDVELISRALGHRGLAHLAAYEPDLAEEWLDRAIAVAREHGHPYAEYEAVHWLSKKKIACLELDDASSLLDLLARTSEASGVASDSPFHRRDASRVLGLRGETSGAASTFVQFFELTAHPDEGRAVAVLACQVHEIEQLHGRSAADMMLDFIDQRVRVGGENEQVAVLRMAVQQLRQRPGTWQPVPYAVEELDVEPDEVAATEAIFRFDVPDLGRLRQVVVKR